MSDAADKKCQIVDSSKKNDISVTKNEQKEKTCSTLNDGAFSALRLLKSFLSNYVKFVQSPYRQDSILKTVQYSLWLLSKFYRNSKTKKALLNLQGEISWARYLLRFFGFPAAIDAVDLKSSWAAGNTSNRLGRVMSWTMIGYYPLEHLSYLFYKAPEIPWLPILSPTLAQNSDGNASCPNSAHYSSAQLASKASAWSCRFWLAWIVLDIVRCTMELRATQQKTMGSPSIPSDDSTSVDCSKDKAETLQHDGGGSSGTINFTTKHIRILRDALYVLPAVTWSLPKWDTDPLLSGSTVNGLCWLESVLGLYQGVDDYRKTES